MMKTARGGWYQCVECGNYMLIDDMQDVKTIDMRVMPDGEFRGKCTHCYKRNNVLYPRLMKVGFLDAMRLTWGKFKGDVKRPHPDGT